MSWEYFYLKRNLGIQEDFLLQKFEEYCENSYDTTHRMEWSCKFTSDSFLTNRFIHSSSIRGISKARSNLSYLLGQLAPNVESLQISSATWEKLVNEMTERITVAYAGSDKQSNHESLIKVYFNLHKYSYDFHNDIVKILFPNFPDSLPPGMPGIMFGFSINRARHYFARMYIYYDATEYADSEVRNYMSQFVGKRTLNLLRSYPRSAVSFKYGATDMVYLSMHQQNSEIRTLVTDIAEEIPFLKERLNKLTWVGIPTDSNYENFPEEMNIYTEIT